LLRDSSRARRVEGNEYFNKRINLLAGMALALSVADPGPSGGRSHAAGGRGNGKVKYITKKELFALFPNRPIALIGEPGHQQFLLLDESAKTGQ
jgi:hypothetical protein